jgi:hypothetical protein
MGDAGAPIQSGFLRAAFNRVPPLPNSERGRLRQRWAAMEDAGAPIVSGPLRAAFNRVPPLLTKERGRTRPTYALKDVGVR